MDFVNNIKVKQIKDNKFKSIIIKFYFIVENKRENYILYCLLVNLLSHTCKKYNSRLKMCKKLDELYNATVDVRYHQAYFTSYMTMSLIVINPLYCDDKELFKKALDFLKEIMLNPNIINNEFNNKILKEKKEALKTTIARVYEDKMNYSYQRMLLSFCSQDEPITFSNNHTLEEVDKVTSKDLIKLYNDTIRNSKKLIYVYGDIENVSEKLQMFNMLYSQDRECVLYGNKDYVSKEIKEVKETADVHEGYLDIGMRIDSNYSEEDTYALKVFNNMFGGLFCSTLIKEVREKRSLCYQIGSTYLSLSKIMMINAGIEKEKYDEVIEIIKDELRKYQEGNIDEELLIMSKNDIINSFITINDDPISCINQEFEYEMNITTKNVNEIIDEYKEITKEDIIKVSKFVKIDTIYMLSK